MKGGWTLAVPFVLVSLAGLSLREPVGTGVSLGELHGRPSLIPDSAWLDQTVEAMMYLEHYFSPWSQISPHQHFQFTLQLRALSCHSAE